MPRVSKEPNLASKNARAKLAPRAEPYFRTIEHFAPGAPLGLRLGYRRTAAGHASWVAAVYDSEKRKRQYHSLGAADDAPQSGGLSYAEAQSAARAWLDEIKRSRASGYEPKGPYTVSDAIDDYLKHYERRGGKAAGRVRSVADTHIKRADKTLGKTPLGKLTKRSVEEWHREMAEAPARLRSKPGAEKPNVRATDGSPESVRRRRSTANRVLTVLKAALNHAYHEGRAANDAAWRNVKPFREVDAARVRYLSDSECKRLVNATSGNFRALVKAALYTGCRYGEITKLRVVDFNPDARAIHVRLSKGGKSRHVFLDDEGLTFFTQLAAGKPGENLLLSRGGREWRPSEQARPLSEACKAAKIEPAITFHELRHTYASRSVMGGADLIVVARQLGHSDTRMVEKHYGHMAPSHVANTFRSAFGPLGLTIKDNVTPISQAS